MDAMDNVHVAGFHEALEGWTDHRFISRDELEAVSVFCMYLVNIVEARGFTLYGHTWKKTGRLGCLVVKVDREGTPYVGFTNASTLIGSMRIFLRRMQEDSVDWRPDRFRT